MQNILILPCDLTFLLNTCIYSWWHLTKVVLFIYCPSLLAVIIAWLCSGAYISFEEYRFAVKARCNLLSMHAVTSRIGHNIHNINCWRCHFSKETLGHLLSSCPTTACRLDAGTPQYSVEQTGKIHPSSSHQHSLIGPKDTKFPWSTSSRSVPFT